MASVNRPYLKWLMILGIIEGVSTLVLFLVAMPMKYYGGQPLAVTVAGGIHGILFLALVGMFLVGRIAVPLSTRLVWWGIIGAIVPFGPFIVDVMLYRLYRQLPNTPQQVSP
ncbi:MAG: DUF3817 domain-containing protein [Planctomycetota bacterium]|nr:DUF3817 domain-containing protein [Planctomycetota bacterium]